MEITQPLHLLEVSNKFCTHPRNALETQVNVGRVKETSERSRDWDEAGRHPGALEIRAPVSFHCIALLWSLSKGGWSGDHSFKFGPYVPFLERWKLLCSPTENWVWETTRKQASLCLPQSPQQRQHHTQNLKVPQLRDIGGQQLHGPEGAMFSNDYFLLPVCLNILHWDFSGLQQGVSTRWPYGLPHLSVQFGLKSVSRLFRIEHSLYRSHLRKYKFVFSIKKPTHIQRAKKMKYS